MIHAKKGINSRMNDDNMKMDLSSEIESARKKRISSLSGDLTKCRWDLEGIILSVSER